MAVGIRSLSWDTQCSVSLGSSPLTAPSARLVFLRSSRDVFSTINLLTREKGSHAHRGPVSVGLEAHFAPEQLNLTHPLTLGEQRGSHTSATPVTCTPCPVAPADDRASRHRGVGRTCSSAPIPLASLSFCIPPSLLLGFPWASPVAQAGKESACNVGDTGSIPALGRSPGEGEDYTLQDSGLENSMDCIVHGVTKSRT